MLNIVAYNLKIFILFLIFTYYIFFNSKSFKALYTVVLLNLVYLTISAILYPSLYSKSTISALSFIFEVFPTIPSSILSTFNHFLVLWLIKSLSNGLSPHIIVKKSYYMDYRLICLYYLFIIFSKSFVLNYILVKSVIITIFSS